MLSADQAIQIPHVCQFIRLPVYFRESSTGPRMENCCDSMVKYFMVLVNFLFTIAGCVLIGFGAWSQIEAKNYLNFLGENYVNTPIFIIILGRSLLYLF